MPYPKNSTQPCRQSRVQSTALGTNWKMERALDLVAMFGKQGLGAGSGTVPN